MSDAPTRRSPIHHLLETRQPQSSPVGDTPSVAGFQTEEAQQAALRTLGLSDVSHLTKLGVKGRNAENWLSNQGVDVPAGIYASNRLADDGLIIRLGTDEFLLQSGSEDESVPALAARLESDQEHVYRVERQEGAFWLVGSRAREVLAQTCGVDFRQAPSQRLVLTRVAGVNCGVFPDPMADAPAYRLWVDYTYAAYLWETLLQICQDLDGRVISPECIVPERQ